MKSPSIDHKAIVEEKKKQLPTFPEIYETAVSSIEDEFELRRATKIALKERREFGLQKYGAQSYEASFENTITTPTTKHTIEEMYDCLNYLIHEVYKNRILGRSEEYRIGIENLLRDMALNLYRLENIISMESSTNLYNNDISL